MKGALSSFGRANLGRCGSARGGHLLHPVACGVNYVLSLLRNECCGRATVCQHLTSGRPGSCSRRFLATPLNEMIFCGIWPRAVRDRHGTYHGLTGSSCDGLRKRVWYGRQDQHQEQASKPSRDGGAHAGSAPLLPLCHGADDRADSPAAGWRCLVLE